jgi:hypothetical protein
MSTVRGATASWRPLSFEVMEHHAPPLLGLPGTVSGRRPLPSNNHLQYIHFYCRGCDKKWGREGHLCSKQGAESAIPITR